MRILLVIPRFVPRFGEFYDFPLGLGYIAASLKHAGYDVHCLNLNNYQESVESIVADKVRKVQPDILGTGGLSTQYRHIKLAIDTAKLISPDLKIMAGGGIISSEPELMLNALKADIGVIGEGEETVVDLIDCLENERNLNSVKGIIFKDIDSCNNERTVMTEKRPNIINIDLIPWTDYEEFDIKTRFSFNKGLFFTHIKNIRFIEMISSRSCPFDCSFCFHPLGRGYRERSLDNFFSELENLIAVYDINALGILDELFATKQERLIEFCSRIKSYNIKWGVQLRVDVVNEDVLDLMKDSGCIVVSYGIESMSQTVLTGMKKHAKPAMIDSVLELTYRKKMTIQGNLIFGDSSETLQSVQETLSWWNKHKKYQLSLNHIQQYPGTKIYNDAISNGAIKDKLQFIEQGCPTLNTTVINNDLFKAILQWVDLLCLVINLPAKLISYSQESTGDKIHGDLYNIECICPHCGIHNNFSKLSKFENMGGRILFRLPCCDCNLRFDIPKLIPEPVFDKYLDILFEIATECLTSDTSRSISLLSEIINIDNSYSKAYYLLGEIFYMNKNFSNAYIYLANAMLKDPSVSFYFRSFGDLLTQIGRIDDANIFYEQQKLLETANPFKL